MTPVLGCFDIEVPQEAGIETIAVGRDSRRRDLVVASLTVSLALVLPFVFPFPPASRPVARTILPPRLSASLVKLNRFFFGCSDKVALNRRGWRAARHQFHAVTSSASAETSTTAETNDDALIPLAFPLRRKTPLSPGRRHEVLFALSLESISSEGSARPRETVAMAFGDIHVLYRSDQAQWIVKVEGSNVSSLCTRRVGSSERRSRKGCCQRRRRRTPRSCACSGQAHGQVEHSPAAAPCEPAARLGRRTGVGCVRREATTKSGTLAASFLISETLYRRGDWECPSRLRQGGTWRHRPPEHFLLP